MLVYTSSLSWWYLCHCCSHFFQQQILFCSIEPSSCKLIKTTILYRNLLYSDHFIHCQMVNFDFEPFCSMTSIIWATLHVVFACVHMTITLIHVILEACSDKRACCMHMINFRIGYVSLERLGTRLRVRRFKMMCCYVYIFHLQSWKNSSIAYNSASSEQS